MKLFLTTIPLILLAAACSSNSEKSAAEKTRENTIHAIQDSIASVEKQKSDALKEIKQLEDSINTLMPNFTFLDNPRWVEGFTIHKSLAANYPLQATGLVARISKNEALELIAACSGASFNSISVSDGAQSIQSQTVPHDQALNYRTGNLTTVAFTGQLADSIAALIANTNSPCTVSFLESGKRVNSYALSSASQNAIAQSWLLCNAHRRILRAERAIPLLAKKAQSYTLSLNELKKSNSSHSDNPK